MKKISSGYILSVVSAVLLLLEVIGVKVNVPYVNEVVMAILGVLIALGIVEGATGKGKKKDADTSIDDTKSDIVDDIKEDIDKISDDIEDILTTSMDDDTK